MDKQNPTDKVMDPLNKDKTSDMPYRDMLGNQTKIQHILYKIPAQYIML